MLFTTLIGNLGANAEVKVANGHEFVTFRVAHNESYTDANNQKVERVMWIDCTMNCTNGRPAVLQYLTKGTMICAYGTISTRIYSSEKDRCMKVGITLHVQRVELLGGSTDTIPGRLYTKDGEMVQISKYYHADTKEKELQDTRGNWFTISKVGWVAPKESNQEPENNG